jgi:hypothetical protein
MHICRRYIRHVRMHLFIYTQSMHVFVYMEILSGESACTYACRRRILHTYVISGMHAYIWCVASFNIRTYSFIHTCTHQVINDCHAPNPCTQSPKAQCIDRDVLIPNSTIDCRCPTGYVGTGRVDGTGCILSVSLICSFVLVCICVF